MKLYGLKNCDSCRKALKWMKDRDLAVEFIDVRGGQMTAADVARFVAAAGWQNALNRKSTTWRGLSEAEKTDIDEAKALDLIIANPALLKRPVIEANGEIVVGFDAAAQARLGEILGHS